MKKKNKFPTERQSTFRRFLPIFRKTEHRQYLSKDEKESLHKKVIQEFIRQAHLSFNLNIALIAISAGISIVGVIILAWGAFPQGTITTAVGMTSNIASIRSLQLSKDINDKLEQLIKAIEIQQ